MAYQLEQEDLLGRLRRIEGQVRGLQRMVEEGRYCIDVVTQISSVRAALDKVALGLLDAHARTCMRAHDGEGGDEQVAELVGAVDRLLRR
jgi:CsoR family transcriptional regulator, copper-sensing transcriptional repressor